jgi:hypothetical protein
MEALLIKALGCPYNTNDMHFRRGDEWKQVKAHEAPSYLAKLAP